MGDRRGISDIIAVVLMIAVAISIGVFVTTFATKWVQEQTTSPSITCALKTNYVVDDVKFNYSGKSDLLVKVTNKGDQDLYGFGFVLENITHLVTFDSTDPQILNQIAVGSALKREESALLRLNLSSCADQSSTFCNESRNYPHLGKTATKVTVRNDACKAVSASITSVTVY